MLHQLSGGQAISRQPLETFPYEVDGKLAHFLAFHGYEQALEAHVGDGVDRVNPFAFFVPVDAGVGALRKECLGRRPEQSMVLCKCVCLGPGLVDPVWHDRNFAGEHLQGHAADHPNVDGGVEGPSKKNLWRSERLGAAHSRCCIAHVVLWDSHRFAEVVQLRETEAVLGDDERFRFGDRVLVTVFAVVDLASFRVLLQLVDILFEEVTGESEQNVVGLDVCVNEEALSVQEVESLESVYQNIFGERNWEVA